MSARSLFGRFFSRASASETPGGVLRRSGAGSSGSDFLTGNDLDAQACDNPFGQVAFVYRAVCAIAEQVATVPFRFAARAEGRDRITEGRLREFYERPHPRLSGFEYWELRAMWLLLRGECFRVPIWETHNGRKRLDRVMMLDPLHFKAVVTDGILQGWRYTARGTNDPHGSHVFLPEEVWYDRLPNPFDPWRGMAPLDLAMAPAASEFAATHWMRAVMENNGDAGVVVSTNEPLDDGQREMFLAALRERKRGIGRADRPLLLWGGAEIVQPKAAVADLDLLNHRKFSLAEISAAFGVPEEIISSLNAAKYDVMRGARLNFIENRVVPFCRRLEAAEQACVQAIDPHARGFFEVEEHPVLAQARRERLKTAHAGFQMGIPFNELNRALDLGFKPLPWGDQGYIPSNMVRV